MARFYLDSPLAPGQTLSLPESVVRHLNVLRLREDETITLFNGNGHAYPARFWRNGKKSAEAAILAEQPGQRESNLHICLIQAISSGERMDFTLQKSVELGVNEIIPVQSERSVVRLSGERAEKRRARWQEIVIAACEQSGRNIVPAVHPIASFHEQLQHLPSADACIMLGLNQTKSLNQVAHQPQRIVFMVGPEGGWTEQEERQAAEAGFQSVLLGKRILRTETAALAAISAMQTLWGDFLQTAE